MNEQKVKIWANTIVKNEENFIWFSIASIVDSVDKILVWDTGSSDNTVKIIEELKKKYPDKISFRQVGAVDKNQFTKIRQQMLDASICDWILIVDGDEVWWKESIKEVVGVINRQGNNLDAIVTPFYNALGDIYHYQNETAGEYKLLGKRGHLTIRAISKKIPGLHVRGPYGVEGYYNANNTPIQENQKLIFINAPFFHLTHLKRSSKDSHGKFKYESGLKFPKDFKLPEAFYYKRPKGVISLLEKRSKLYELIGFLKTPFLNIWRTAKFRN